MQTAEGPFTLGVASGDPWPDGMVLWTRLAPHPFDPGGGMPPEPVAVTWQVAEDPGFARIVREGTEMADPALAHSVHAEVAGLAPGQTYYYRFIANGDVSATGRTRTAPPPGAMDWVRFASCGCQNYEQGYYTAFRRLAEEDIDFVVHTGDYIYEGAGHNGRDGTAVRTHPPQACVTLAQYRLRYATYKSDPDLQAAHAAHPFLCTFDDHEVANDWAGDETGTGSPESFLLRRQAAFRAWYEHLPVRKSAFPQGPHMRMFRRLRFGRLLEVNLCDTRQYRTPQPCGGRTELRCPDDSDPGARMLGAEQERWLMGGLSRSGAVWNVIAQQVVMAEFQLDGEPGSGRYNMDKWDGYRAPRDRLLDYLARGRVPNPVVLSGDFHRHLAFELRRHGAPYSAPPVAAEFTNTSISSNGDGKNMTKRYRSWLELNPHLSFVSGLRGYCRFTVTHDRWRTDFRTLDYVEMRGARVKTRDSRVLEAGRHGRLTA